MSSPSHNASAPAERAESPIVLALWLALAPATAIGFGRFGYALVLPAMRSDMAWTYAQAGALNTANAAGYLLGALLTAPATRIWHPRLVMLAGLAASVAALAGAGLSHSFLVLLACRALVGASAAFTFIAGSGLAARLGRSESENALAMGLALNGPGLGVILTGLLVPFLLADDASRWPRAWLAMAFLGGLFWLGVWARTRSLQEPQVLAAAPSAQEQDVESSPHARADFRSLRPALVAYFLYGLGYIAYMTFLVAYVRSLGASPGAVSLTWSVLGSAMFASALVWRRAFERESGGRTMAQMGSLGALSAALPLFSDSLAVLLLSAALFGLCSMPIFTAVTVLIRRHLPPSTWTSGIALATVTFATGQSLGPLGSGWASDHFGPRASLAWTCGLMLVASAVALAQKRPASERARS